jgi:hypothetical protein
MKTFTFENHLGDIFTAYCGQTGKTECGTKFLKQNLFGF